MDEVERQAKLKAQTDELYRAIGRCVVACEQFTHEVGTGLRAILQKEGLKSERIARIITGGQTAGALVAMFKAVFIEAQALTGDDERIRKALFTRMDGVVASRNLTIHSTWFVGWAAPEETDFSTAVALSAKKLQPDVRRADHTVADFAAFELECNAVADLVHRFSVCMLFGNVISKNIKLAPDGTISSP